MNMTPDPPFAGSFRFGAIRLWFAPRSPLAFHGFPGRTLHSAFGKALKGAVCSEPECLARPCLRPETCEYGLLFRPSDPGRVAGAADLPSAVTVRFPFGGPVVFEAGEEMPLDIILVGRALEHQEAFARAVVQMSCVHGLGAERVLLDQTRVEDLLTGRENQGDIRSWADLCGDRPGVDACEVVFLSPAELVRTREGEDTHLERLEFHDLVWAAAQRVGLLAFAHCAADRSDAVWKEIRAWRDALATQARDVRRLAARLRVQGQSYAAHRSPNMARFQGVRGRALYAGDIAPFMPLLRAAEIVHIGKHATFGWGQIAVNTGWAAG